MKKIECYFDGCCEPRNPGGAMGMGAIVKIDGETAFTFSDFVPQNSGNTNNIAEYKSMEAVIDYLLNNGLDNEDVTIKGDSQLAVRQMIGEYGINSGAYVPYAQRCLTKLSTFRKTPSIKWIPREMNEEADNLSKGHLAKNNIQVATHADSPDMLTFGKYKGKSVNAIQDMQYLKWAFANVKLRQSQKDAIQSRIAQLEFEAK